MDFPAYLDLMIPSVALAQGFGRIGCFLAGCCYGKETDGLLGVTFTQSNFAPNNVRLFPSQLVMSAGDFVIAAILLMYAKKERPKGKTSALYLMLYSVGRFFVEFTRNDNRGTVGVLSTSQFIGIFIFIIGAALFFGIIPARNRKQGMD
jgi:phosphatidylglycerol:prolipoprotein diacylglycerol transferase